MATQDPPIGSIVAFAGPIEKVLALNPNWALCDGRLVNRTTTQWKALFDAIGSSWGGDGADQFRLPALNGMFLRGVNSPPAAANTPTSIAGVDPEAGSRTAIQAGGHAGDQVGTKQDESFHVHNHPITDNGHSHSMNFNFDKNASTSAYERAAGNQPDPRPFTNSSKTGISLADAGGAETRPINASVFWIIRIA